jgi:hypothetical protein
VAALILASSAALVLTARSLARKTPPRLTAGVP